MTGWGDLEPIFCPYGPGGGGGGGGGVELFLLSRLINGPLVKLPFTPTTPRFLVLCIMIVMSDPELVVVLKNLDLWLKHELGQ